MVCVVCELQNPSMSVFLNGLESSGWMCRECDVVCVCVRCALRCAGCGVCSV